MQGLAVTPPCFIFVEYFLPRLKEYFCWVVFFLKFGLMWRPKRFKVYTMKSMNVWLPWKSGESNAEKRLVVDVFFDVDVVVLCSCLLEPQKNYWLQKNMNVPVE